MSASLPPRQELHAALHKFIAARRPHSATTNILANALHAVFTVPHGDDGTRGLIQDACFHYLKTGGMKSAGPIGLLAGLCPRPLSLVLHFFNVALYGVGGLCFPIPTPTRVKQSYKVLRTACQIILPMIAVVSEMHPPAPALQTGGVVISQACVLVCLCCRRK